MYNLQNKMGLKIDPFWADRAIMKAIRNQNQAT